MHVPVGAGSVPEGPKMLDPAPDLCYHVDIGPCMGKDEPLLDPYSLDIGCQDCRKVAQWLSAIWKESRANNIRQGL